MGLSLKNFVDININYFKSEKPISSRDTVVLLDNDDNLPETDAEFKSITDIDTEFSNIDDTTKLKDLKSYCKIFFENNGQVIHYINIAHGAGQPAAIAVLFVDVLKLLPNEEIAFTILHHSDLIEADYSTMINTIAEKLVTTTDVNNKLLFSGINEKILVAAFDSDAATITPLLPGEQYRDNLIFKYGKPGIEMTVLAFLSNINVYRGNIEDYCYTQEEFDENDTVQIVDTDSEFKALSEINLNFEIELPAYGTLNYGGNKLNGKDLVNDFCKIVLTQTLTQRLIGALTQKLRYDENGLSIISGIIGDELQKYKKFGYLTTDKSWGDADYYDGNYLIISRKTPLLQGYYYTILPFSSLTPDEKKDHKMPNIHIILAESYSVRMINIEGKII